MLQQILNMGLAEKAGITGILIIIAGYAADLVFGDPHWLPHPVRFIGWLIRTVEKALRKWVDRSSKDKPIKTEQKIARQKQAGKQSSEPVKNIRERQAGKVLAFSVPMILFLLVYLILKAAQSINPYLYYILNIYFIFSALATKCLGDEAKKVYSAVLHEGLEKARKQLSWLVGRDTDSLSESQVIRGTVETVAENIVDGIISPLFYICIGSIFGLGAPLGYAYKAVNTLDSMVGYMNDKYLHFGRASAKLDDAANYIPARITGLLIPLASLLCGKNAADSFKIMRRDRRNHKSPNCAYPEAAIAGALGVQLGGTNSYFGQQVYKPTIGDKTRELKAADILDTIRISYVTSLLALLIFTNLVWIIALIYR